MPQEDLVICFGRFALPLRKDESPLHPLMDCVDKHPWMSSFSTKVAVHRQLSSIRCQLACSAWGMCVDCNEATKTNADYSRSLQPGKPIRLDSPRPIASFLYMALEVSFAPCPWRMPINLSSLFFCDDCYISVEARAYVYVNT